MSCSLLISRLSLLIFVFKQKTAYEMRISDWSSDVCSSDLLALVDPVPPKRRQGLWRDRLVGRDEARDPAIAEVLVIEGIEDARPAEARKAENSERADVKVTETRLQPPDQRCVGKDTVQIHWRLGSDHRMVAVGYGVMQKA